LRLQVEQCLFVDKPAVAVHEYLKENLVAQDRAIESVVAAVESWEFSYVMATRSQCYQSLMLSLCDWWYLQARVKQGPHADGAGCDWSNGYGQDGDVEPARRESIQADAQATEQREDASNGPIDFPVRSNFDIEMSRLRLTISMIRRGEDFSDTFSNPITEYHTQIKTRLVEHLQFCSGKAVVVFDEVQKVIPHTLDGEIFSRCLHTFVIVR
jgi:hypothetical protein